MSSVAKDASLFSAGLFAGMVFLFVAGIIGYEATVSASKICQTVPHVEVVSRQTWKEPEWVKDPEQAAVHYEDMPSGQEKDRVWSAIATQMRSTPFYGDYFSIAGREHRQKRLDDLKRAYKTLWRMRP